MISNDHRTQATPGLQISGGQHLTGQRFYYQPGGSLTPGVQHKRSPAYFLLAHVEMNSLQRTVCEQVCEQQQMRPGEADSQPPGHHPVHRQPVYHTNL
jgi:hypothetical protein